jgi:hypothetical protein
MAKKVLPFPGFDKLYLLEAPYHDNYMRGETEDNTWALTLGKKKPPARLTVRRQMGGACPADFVWNCWGSPFVSQRVIDVLKASGCTGWKCFPVRMLNKAERLAGRYYGLVITGRCGPDDPEMSEIKADSPRTYPRLIGLYFHPETYDGSDLFLHRADAHGGQAGYMSASKKLVEAFEQADVKNVRLELLAKYDQSLYNVVATEGSPERSKAFWRRVSAAYRNRGWKKPDFVVPHSRRKHPK